jgi:hypothetical protein
MNFFEHRGIPYCKACFGHQKIDKLKEKKEEDPVIEIIETELDIGNKYSFCFRFYYVFMTCVDF